jgi:hypothetical protein
MVCSAIFTICAAGRAPKENKNTLKIAALRGLK